MGRTRPDAKKGAAERDAAALKQYKRLLLLRNDTKLALDEGIRELREKALETAKVPEIPEEVFTKAKEAERLRRKELYKLKIAEVHATRAAISKRSRGRKIGTIERFEQVMELCDAYVLTEKGHKKTPRKSQGTPNKASPSTRRHEKTKDDTDSDDEPLVRSSSAVTRMHKTPPYLAGTLRQYQVNGVNWMLDLHQNCLSGILADEMGLGKTFQTIALLSFLKYSLKLPGPHLVICPRSILGNWNREFARWSPGMRPFVFHGAKDERRALRKRLTTNLEADVVLSTWEQVNLELSAFKKVNFQYLILDEGHKIKNEESTVSSNVRQLKCVSRLLLTGTPLQNNLRELWALLNFLMPAIFQDADDFEGWFDTAAGTSESKVMDRLHKMLNPFMLRRVKTEADAEIPPKKEVYVACKLSKMQRLWYQTILARDTELVNDDDGVKSSATALKNIMMQLRKCCNHPYLFEGAEEPPFITDESLIKNSGKMIILDKLLNKLLSEPKETRQKILIFSQMTRVLDIISDYLEFRKYRYCRLDGSTPGEERDLQMNDFNSPNTDKQVFILSTRAGGLGINLQSASVVILFDSDWNPQQDLQAMDRAHRIGQKRPVTVFRFITEGTMEERMYHRAMKKLYLDAIVVQQGNLQNRKSSDNLSADEVKGMIRWGAAAIFKNEEDDIENVDIDKIIDMGAKFQSEVEKKLEGTQQKSLQNFNLGIEEANMYEFEGVDYTDRPTKTLYIKTNTGAPILPKLEESLVKHGPIVRFLISPEQTKAVVTYKALDDSVAVMAAVNNKVIEGCEAPLILNYGSKATIVTETMKMDIEKHMAEIEAKKRKEATAQRVIVEHPESHSAVKVKGVTLPKLPKMHPWQFFDIESIEDLHEMKCQRLIAENNKDPNAAEKFTEENEAELKRLQSAGFPEWNHRMLMKLVDTCAKLGRECSEEVAEATSRPVEEVTRYMKAFWENGPHTLERFELFKKRIAAGEASAKMLKERRVALKKRLDEAKGLNPYSPTVPLGKLSKVLPAHTVDRYSLCYSYAANNNWHIVTNKLRTTPELFFDITAQTKNPTRFAMIKKIQGDLATSEKNKRAPPAAPAPIKRQKNEPEESKAKKRAPKK